MELLVLLLSVLSCLVCGRYAGNVKDPTTNLPDPLTNLTDSSGNLTDPKDMYVIHATVYQVGILTDRTDNTTGTFNSTGNQESVTLYHTNGTNVDLSSIPDPFLTNVTAQTLVGVAPIPHNNSSSRLDNAWVALNQLTHPASTIDNKSTERTQKRSVYDFDDVILRLFKRDASERTPGNEKVVNGGALIPPEADATEKTPGTSLKVVNGAALIPPEAGIQSISLPPLLALNNNLTQIPVPIPNTSVVHYAKVSTLIQKP